MSYDACIAYAENLISNYNSSVSALKLPDTIDINKFKEKLIKAGGVSEAALKLLSWEDLLACGLPLLIAKQLAEKFRGNSQENLKVKDMSSNQLFSKYNPKTHTNRIGTELKRRSRGLKCVLFDENDEVLINESAKLLEELEDYGEREVFYFNSKPLIVYKVGELPNKVFVENPLFIGKPLRSDNSCTETEFTWGNNLKTVQTIIFLAIRNTGELKINSYQDAVYIIDLLDRNTESRIKMRYKKATLLFEKLRKTNNLPSMLISETKYTKGQFIPKNDPFYAHKTY